VIAAGLLLLYLPRALAWIAVVVYIPLAVWLVIKILTQTIKRDWVYISLMLLPMPVITGWFLAAQIQRDFAAYSGYTMERLHYFGPGVGISFLALGLAVVAFARIRRRWLKIAVLFMTGVTTVLLLCFYAWGKLETVPFLLLMLLLGSIFFIPAILASGARSGRWGRVFENRPMQANGKK
jgi:peptidoglycan/LPS O-acetylase OafA/YrhL